MKIHKLWAENVRGIESRVIIELSPTGLNLVTAPNEMGKTTMAEVLGFIFQSKSNSEDKKIKDLQPYGKDVGPLMGAKIEVNGQIYEIEKQWLKSKKTEVNLISPEKSSVTGNAADKLIDEIFTKQLDESIWKMIQVAQANFTELIDKPYGDEKRAALSEYLAQAVADTEGFDVTSLIQKVDDEYLDWWTPKGKAATSAGTSGRLIVEKSEDLERLMATVADLKLKINDAASVKEEIIVKRESREVLQNRKQAQDTHKELTLVQRELSLRTSAQEAIDKLLADNPRIKTFSSEIFNAINDDRVLHGNYFALNSIKLSVI